MKSTVAFQEFNFDEPFAEGHACTIAEADALNTARKEKLASQIRKDVEALNKAAKDKSTEENPVTVSPEDLAAVQAKLNKLAAEFIFEISGPAEPKLTPEQREIRTIAKGILADLLAKHGLTAKAYGEKPDANGLTGKDKIEAKVAEFSARDDVVKEAKKRLASRAKIASVEGDTPAL